MFQVETTQRSGLSSNANGFFYLSHQRSGQRLKSKNCLQVLSFEHLISFILKRLRHFSLRDMFSRSSWWNRLGHFSLRSRSTVEFPALAEEAAVEVRYQSTISWVVIRCNLSTTWMPTLFAKWLAGLACLHKVANVGYNLAKLRLASL